MFSNYTRNVSIEDDQKFTMGKESNAELQLFGTLLEWKNGKISVLVYRKPTNTDQHLHYSSHHQTSCKEIAVSFFFYRVYSIITNENDLNKENVSIKQALKELVTAYHNLPQSQEQTQATDIKE